MVIKLDHWATLSDEQQASFAPICPDFVIELRPFSDTLAGLQKKMQKYMQNSALLRFLIERPETVSGDPGLPGFVLQMAKIW